MPVIHVPRPKRSAMNPDRPVNALLQAQIQHLQHAEQRLPLRYRSAIYAHAIQTEGEAAEYIQKITKAIHQAHADAAAKRTKQKKGLRIVAAAERPPKTAGSKVKGKKSPKPGRKK
jgi:hypothetical protein